MNSSTIVVYPDILSTQLSHPENEQFLQDFSGQQIQALKKMGCINNQTLFANTSQKPQPEKTNSFLTKNEQATIEKLSPELKAVTSYLLARGESALSETTSRQIADHMVSSENANSQNKYVSDCIFKSIFYVPTANKKSLCRFEIQLHYQTKINGKMMKLNPETGKLQGLSLNEQNEMQDKIHKIQTELFNDEQFKLLQQKLTLKSDLLVIAKTIEKKIEEELNYRPINFACNKTTFTGINKNTVINQLPLDYFPCSKYNESSGKTSIDHSKLPDLSKIKNEKFYETINGVYAQVDYFALCSTIDVQVRHELTEKINKLLTPNEKENIAYQERNLVHALKITPNTPQNEIVSLANAGFIAWVIELMNAIGRAIKKVFSSENTEEKQSNYSSGIRI